MFWHYYGWTEKIFHEMKNVFLLYQLIKIHSNLYLYLNYNYFFKKILVFLVYYFFFFINLNEFIKI